MASDDENSQNSEIDYGQKEEERMLKAEFEELLRLEKEDQCHIDLDPEDFFQRANAGVLPNRARAIRNEDRADLLDGSETKKTRRQMQRNRLDELAMTPPSRTPKKYRVTPYRTSTMKAKHKSPRRFEYNVDPLVLSPSKHGSPRDDNELVEFAREAEERQKYLREKRKEMEERSSVDPNQYLQRSPSKSPQRYTRQKSRSRTRLRREPFKQPRIPSPHPVALGSPRRSNLLTEPQVPFITPHFRRIRSQPLLKHHPDEIKEQHKSWREKREKSLSRGRDKSKGRVARLTAKFEKNLITNDSETSMSSAQSSPRAFGRRKSDDRDSDPDFNPEFEVDYDSYV